MEANINKNLDFQDVIFTLKNYFSNITNYEFSSINSLSNSASYTTLILSTILINYDLLKQQFPILEEISFNKVNINLDSSLEFIDILKEILKFIPKKNYDNHTIINIMEGFFALIINKNTFFLENLIKNNYDKLKTSWFLFKEECKKKTNPNLIYFNHMFISNVTDVKKIDDLLSNDYSKDLEIKIIKVFLNNYSFNIFCKSCVNFLPSILTACWINILCQVSNDLVINKEIKHKNFIIIKNHISLLHKYLTLTLKNYHKLYYTRYYNSLNI